MDTRDPELKKDLDATLQTRKELGTEYESELVESFLEKLDQSVDRRVRRQLAEQQMVVARGVNPRPQQRTQAQSGFSDGIGARLGLAVASLVLAIPLSAIAAVNAGNTGLLVCWGSIVAVNALQASRSWFDTGDRRERKQTSDWD
ncbi:hypothetical protein DVA86_15960 [Streptomyces armeniacus]|uniref:Integral membrane protein n=1 Tax=Streptomyces armeniacus TaxID=83291 RepID=A0A345XQL5_9ACTN|nr:hypothetical protein [Streptomyces armeniacus]AXK33931.1 hypothetical protein DVA86_15960 [Streptomyces armeniacus]